MLIFFVPWIHLVFFKTVWQVILMGAVDGHAFFAVAVPAAGLFAGTVVCTGLCIGFSELADELAF